jgi:hypothetical protein
MTQHVQELSMTSLGLPRSLYNLMLNHTLYGARIAEL